MSFESFNIPGNPQMNTDFEDTHVVKWAREHFANGNEYRISLMQYLRDVGFCPTLHRLTGEQVKILRYALNYFSVNKEQTVK